ncbi:MAG: PAS domain-containing sensor histidine kinase, partial [Aquincola sp.]|nr:PAS domain-containing sensor histidine kinase [Aquincola sp.]
EADAVQRDTEIAQQQMRLVLSDDQEQLLRLAREIGSRTLDSRTFPPAAAEFARERPALTHVSWILPNRTLRATYATAMFHPEVNPTGEAMAADLPVAGENSEAEHAFGNARSLRSPTYSGAFRSANGMPVFQLHVPLFDQGAFSGMLITEYSIETLLRQSVPPEVTQRHTVAVVDASGVELAGNVLQMPGRPTSRPTLVHELPVVPAANGMVLRGMGWRTSVGLVSNTLFWMVVALSVLTVWMLLGTWRHMRRRGQMQSALVQETNFRRAMENSMLTGMRAMDNEGRITYVNPAFCAMTGFSEADLVGRVPPFPYWPLDRIDENMRLLQQELHGRSPAGGIEVKAMRKDGSLFDARMYVSPLIDARGHQTGWMTSMTNITEAKRIRDQLSASHERFTTVLEGLDAAVSVLSVQQGELLFANRSYRLWFGADPKGHAQLAGHVPPLPPTAGDDGDDVDSLSGIPAESLTSGGADPREVYVEPLKKWFDVRSRYLQWTDGRLAQMLIATDITSRRRIEEQAARQAERAQVTSRLVTMGEMASSVAHELNQPLAAIANYCNGMVSRVRAESIGKDDLIAALTKTSRQAERAGQIIHRIRSFVKRSEPQRQRADAKAIVDDVLDLAGIELRRRNVSLTTYVAHHLPPLQCDPILIQQVVLNLLKNAGEAIDAGQMPPARRHVELRVMPHHSPEEGGVVEFSVTDQGPGVREDVLARLYEAFYSTKAEGLGIGLALCRSIIESHRGRMRAQNLYNSGSVTGCRFSFTLPVDLPVRTDGTGPVLTAESAPAALVTAPVDPTS